MKSPEKIEPVLRYLEGEFYGEGPVEWEDDFDLAATKFRVRARGRKGYLLVKILDEFIEDDATSLEMRLKDMKLGEKLRQSNAATTLVVISDGTVHREERQRC